MKRLVNASIHPSIFQFQHAALHVRCHTHGAQGVILVVRELWRTEEGHDAIADDLANGCAVAVGNRHHLRQIFVQQSCKLLRVKVIGSLGKAFNVGKNEG